MDYGYLFGNLLALGSMVVFYVCIKLIYETLDMIMETVKICLFVRENPDKVSMEQTAKEWDVPHEFGLGNAKYNKQREEFLKMTDEHEAELHELREDLEA